MSTEIEITGVGIDAEKYAQAIAIARMRADEWEQRFSRFRPGSTLSRLNAANGAPFAADDIFIDLLDLTARAVERTEGRFDPSILPALEWAGYDRSFELIRQENPFPHEPPCQAVGLAGWRQVVIDRERMSVTLPSGMRIDLGGIAKGSFIDTLAQEFAGWPGGCIDAGGDLLVWGEPPFEDAWLIGIEDPARQGVDVAVLRVEDPHGIAVATSAMNRRRWGAQQHHLIDPSSGTPIRSDITSVTAGAETVAAAEVTTKALFVAFAHGAARIDLIDSEWAAWIDVSGHMTVVQKET